MSPTWVVSVADYYVVREPGTNWWPLLQLVRRVVLELTTRTLLSTALARVYTNGPKGAFPAAYIYCITALVLYTLLLTTLLLTSPFGSCLQYDPMFHG